MEHEEILTALEEISDKHIKEAEKPPKKNGRTFFKIALAAVLMIALGVNMLFAPARIHAYAVAEPSETRMMELPDIDDYKEWEGWEAACRFRRSSAGSAGPPRRAWLCSGQPWSQC